MTWEPAAPLSTEPDGGRASNNAASASSKRRKKAPVRAEPVLRRTGPNDGPPRTPADGAVDRSPRAGADRSRSGARPPCRHRAWEQSRAANSGRMAVQVVERRVEIRVPLEPTRRDWPRLLGELAGQLDDGRVYDRDLPALGRALDPVLRSYRRRARWSGAPDLP